MNTNQAKFETGSKVKVAADAVWAAQFTGEGQVGIACLAPREGKPSVWMYSVWFDDQRLTIGEHDLVSA
jgi:hypothetical protein